jgi:CHASE2 domain-containing sensor protein
MHVPLVRYLEIARPIPRLATEPPVRMLVAIPRSPNLRVAEEKGFVLAALDELLRRRLVELTVLDDGVTLARLGQTLAEGRHDVLHFVGHGSFVEGQAFLRLDGEGDKVHDVSDEEFGELFVRPPKLVFLNSCEGAATSSSRPMAGMAPQLVARGVPAVVAMQYEVHDRPAVAFARAFYGALFRGGYRGRVDAAMCFARKRLVAEFPGQRDVGAPVLFLRAEDGVLFDFDSPAGPAHALDTSDRTLDRNRAYARAHARNLALLAAQRRAAPSEELEREIQTGQTALARLRRRRNGSLLAGLGLVLAVYLAGYLQILDLLQLDTRLRNLVAVVGAALVPSARHPDIVVVPVTAQTLERLGRERVDRSWRPTHAVLVERLADAGAKVVALDFTFVEPGEHEALVAAIARARERGTAVIVAVREHGPGGPRLAGALRETVTAWGLSCLGTQLGRAVSVPVAVAKPTAAIPSLPAIAAYLHAKDRIDIRLHDPARHRIVAAAAEAPVVTLGGFGLEPEEIPGSEWRTVARAQPGCPAIEPGDRVLERILDLSPVPARPDRSRRIPYERVVMPSPLEDPSRFAGRIVLVGEERRPAGAARVRTPLDVQADAISTLLGPAVIGPPAPVWQLVTIVGMVLLGVVARVRRPVRPRAWGLVATGGVLLAWSALAVLLYVTRRVLPDVLYSVAAFALAYYGTAKVRRGWLPPAAPPDPGG